MRFISLLLLLAIPAFANPPTPPPDTGPHVVAVVQSLQPELALAAVAALAAEVVMVPAVATSHFTSGSTHASGLSAFTNERDMSIKNVTAKLRCNMKKTNEVQAHDLGQYVNQHITLNAVYSPDPADPNYSYSKATPSADLSMYVTNPVAAEFFEQGAEYLVTFERVQRPKPVDEPATS